MGGKGVCRRAHVVYALEMRWILLLAVCGACGSPGPGGPPEAQIAGVREVGTVANPSLSNVLRDGGAGGRVGGKLLWTFGDTLLTFKAEDGLSYRSNSAAFAELDVPLVLSEPTDSKGAPHQLLPFNQEELAYNQSTGKPDDRFALWPTAVISLGENGLILYNRLKVRPGLLNFEAVSTGMALVRPASTVAVRYPEIFTVPEPQFHHAAALHAGMLHLYACSTEGRCRVARAPFENATERSAYEFWTGSGWSAAVADAAETVPGSTTGFSVVSVSFQKQFVAIISKPFSGTIVLRTALEPQGPWSDELLVYEVGAQIYATVQHPELVLEAGRKLFFSYYLPADAFDGDVRLVELTLK